MSEPGRRYHLVLTGALLGAAAGDVLLALNPHLLGVAGAVRLVGGAASLGALAASPLLLLPSPSRRPSRAFWGALAVVLAVAGAAAESQRTLYYLFLGNGTRRLLVAVTALGVAGAVGAAALARQRPAAAPAHGSLAVLLALFLAVPLWGQRRPVSSALSFPEPLPRAGRRSALVVAVEGVSWELLSRLASDGTLPVTARLLGEGSAGALGSLAPYDGAALWTTAATGKRPSRHGVLASREVVTPLGRLRLLPRTKRLAPPERLPFADTVAAAPDARRSLFFWEILAARGHEVAVLNWPASEPARPGLVLWATEGLFAPAAAPGSGLPEDAARRARLMRVDPERLDRPLARALSPAGISPAAAAEADALRGAARDLSVAGATLAAVPAGAGSVSAVRLSGLSGPVRPFGPAAEPTRYWGAPPRDADARALALTAYYRFLDEVLGDLLERGGRDRTLCVFSPVGYGPPGNFRALLDLVTGREPRASPDAAGDGFLILWGSGIRSGVRLTSASVWDVAPTLLVLSGEPIARDMDGRVLGEVFDERFSETESVPVITTYEPGGPQ